MCFGCSVYPNNQPVDFFSGDRLEIETRTTSREVIARLDTEVEKGVLKKVLMDVFAKSGANDVILGLLMARQKGIPLDKYIFGMSIISNLHEKRSYLLKPLSPPPPEPKDDEGFYMRSILQDDTKSPRTRRMTPEKSKILNEGVQSIKGQGGAFLTLEEIEGGVLTTRVPIQKLYLSLDLYTKMDKIIQELRATQGTDEEETYVRDN
jgi:hypothetical protein